MKFEAIINVDKCLGSKCTSKSMSEVFPDMQPCVYVCRAQKIKVGMPDRLDLTDRVVDNGCTGCMECVDVCPVGAITMEGE